MKILYFVGYSDYDALDFARSEPDLKALYEEYKDKEDTLYSGTYEGNEFEGDIRCYEFGDVCPDFLEFVKNEISDYDASKQADFYVVEESDTEDEE